jgi:serine/threonine protein kinase
MIGQIISHYKILEKLGEGGMGVVYKAHDTDLDRDVALKFLPHHVTADEADQARFLQEARAAAVLNHPNICTVHAIEKADDQQFIVMEYVDGKTLRQLIPIQKTQIAVDYAIQIGEALQEAHSQRIVHRDVKAENIMVNSKNQIKVMDFGLAKLKGSLKLTKTSSTVGTLAYMAPEQIQGGEVDARSDIFSFGVVLYEMLTGHMPFRGEHEAAMVYSIVNEPALPIEKYLPDVSSELVHVINRALEKDPEDRYQFVHEMVIDLRRLKKQTSRVSHSMNEFTPESTHEAGLDTKGKIVLVATSLVIGAIAIATLVFFLWRPAARLNPNIAIKPLDIPFSLVGYPALSPDGKQLAFPARDADGKWAVYNMHVTGGEPSKITTDSSEIDWLTSAVSFSPDGSMIAYSAMNPKSRQSEIRLVSSLGGVSRVVSQEGFSGKWRPDGQRIGFYRHIAGRKAYWTVEPNGTNERLEFKDTLGTSMGNQSYSWSPDGNSITWLRTSKEMFQEIIVRDLATGTERQVTHEGSNIDEVCWASNDQIIYSTNKVGSTTLWMIPASGGESVQISKEGPDMGMSISADCKRLVFYRRKIFGFIRRAGIDGSDSKQVTFDARRIQWVDISPDRKWILFSGGTDEFDMRTGIYLVDRDGHQRRVVVPPSEDAFHPVWSPDGKWIVYSSQGANTPLDSSKIFLLDAANLGTRHQIVKGVAARWIDSRTLHVRRGMRSWLLDIFTREEKAFFRDSASAFPVSRQQHIVYYDRRAQTPGWWIVPSYYDDQRSARPRLLFSPSEPLRSEITADKSQIILWDDNGNLWKIFLPSGKRERIPATFPGLTRASVLSASYDGREIVYMQQHVDTKLFMIDNLFQ